ncbi:MAG: metallophosphoesterase family protein [Nocardioidaceae bacterium]
MRQGEHRPIRAHGRTVGNDPEHRLGDIGQRVALVRLDAGAITTVGGFDWLASLPVEQRIELPNASTALLVHASPGHDDGPGVHSELSDQELLDAGVASSGAHVIFVGHTHVPLERTVAGIRVVNVGSVSLPFTSERRAMWTLLDADEAGVTLERRFADYDMDAVAMALDSEHHPDAEWLKAKLFREPVA